MSVPTCPHCQYTPGVPLTAECPLCHRDVHQLAHPAFQDFAQAITTKKPPATFGTWMWRLAIAGTVALYIVGVVDFYNEVSRYMERSAAFEGAAQNRR